MQKYDIAAFVWPSYTGDELRSRMFWPEGMGEWQTVKAANAKQPWHEWPRKPLWGYCNEADPYVMEMQISAALAHGVNTFIYDWYWYDNRPFLENCLNDGFLKAKNCNEMQFYLMWANHDANGMWDKRISDTDSGNVTIWEGAVDRSRFETIAHRIITKYFALPNYYKINNAPILAVYDVFNLVKGLGSVEKARDALDWFRAETVKAGFSDLHLQFISWNPTMTYCLPANQEESVPFSRAEIVKALGYNSITNYQFVHMTNMNRDYNEAFEDIKKQWTDFEKEFDIPYFPHVSIGWDNNPRYQSWKNNVCRNNTPENFEKALRGAKNYVDTHKSPVPLITINSWNEWTETSYLEPDDRFGYGYLDAVKRVFGA